MAIHGLMWWVDRWRKSTAYMDMTLQEQGAYRNLLDEAFLRGGALPNDERVLARACGDVMEWKRVRTAVLARFVVIDGVLRNQTLDEVIHQTQRRIEKQKRYRDKKGNGGGNGGGNDDGNGAGNERGNELGNAARNKPGYPDPDPDRELSKNQESSRRARERVFTGQRLKVSKAQHQVVLDELGDRASTLNLLALYGEWDRELQASGADFDTLVLIKSRALASLQAPAPAVSLVDWFEECQRLHGGECGASLRHHTRMLMDAEKARKKLVNA